MLDNDRPSVNASSTSPVEEIDLVILTCVGNSSDVITGYIWYANNVLIESALNNTYSLPSKKRVDDGDYSCKVITRKAPISPMSLNTTITFMCKYFIIMAYKSLGAQHGLHKKA